MTSNKYIVKKCPCIKTTEYYLRDELITERICTSNRQEFRLCQNRTDCVIKQVIENCKEVENVENVKTLYDAAQSGMFLQANRILKLLDIEEIDK